MKKYLVVMMALLVSGSAFATQAGDKFFGKSDSGEVCRLTLESFPKGGLVVSGSIIGPNTNINLATQKLGFIGTLNRVEGVTYTDLFSGLVSFQGVSTITKVFLDSDTLKPVRLEVHTQPHHREHLYTSIKCTGWRPAK